MPANVQDAAVALALALLVPAPGLALLLVLLAQPARPVLTAIMVITAATVVCRIGVLLKPIVERFSRISGQHTLRARCTQNVSRMTGTSRHRARPMRARDRTVAHRPWKTGRR